MQTRSDIEKEIANWQRLNKESLSELNEISIRKDKLNAEITALNNRKKYIESDMEKVYKTISTLQEQALKLPDGVSIYEANTWNWCHPVNEEKAQVNPNTEDKKETT